MIDPAVVQKFLALDRIAVVGASPDPKSFGNTVYKALRDHGCDVVPVNPNATEVEGDRCYIDLESVPDPIDGVLVMVGPAKAAHVVRQCAQRGIRNIWLFKGLGGPGSASDEAIELAQELGLDDSCRCLPADVPRARRLVPPRAPQRPPPDGSAQPLRLMRDSPAWTPTRTHPTPSSSSTASG